VGWSITGKKCKVAEPRGEQRTERGEVVTKKKVGVQTEAENLRKNHEG